MRIKSILRPRVTPYLLALLAIAVSGCTQLAGDGITDLTLEVVTSDGVNPDRNGRPSPVFLQVFELRDGSAFRSAGYLEIYRDPEAALGLAFIGKSEVGPLYPGVESQEELRLSPTATAVGIIGEFNRYQDMNSTMQLIELDPGRDKSVKLLVDAKGLWLR